MAQFIHLSLLLATIQLPLVSVTHLWLQEGSSVTFKCPQQWKVKHSFKPSGVTETNCPLTINNFKPEDRGIYIFYGSSNSPADIAHLLTIEGATVQLPLVSVSLQEGSKVTFKLPQGWKVQYCCRDNKCECVSGESEDIHRVSVTNSFLTINNIEQEHSGKYTCYEDSQTNTDQRLSLNITIGAESQGDISTKADCIKNTNLPNTFLSFKNLLLTSSKVEVELQLSGFPPSNGSGKLIDDAGLQFHQENKSWIDALEHCHRNKSDLVQINNATVQKAVNSLLQGVNMTNGVWIGLERSILGLNPPWKWTSGKQVENTQWNDSFPVDKLNYHCGKIVLVNASQECQFKWLDASCHEALPFICQGAPTERPDNVTEPT